MIRTGMGTDSEMVSMSRKEFDERIALTYELGVNAGKLEGSRMMLDLVMKKLKEQQCPST